MANDVLGQEPRNKQQGPESVCIFTSEKSPVQGFHWSQKDRRIEYKIQAHPSTIFQSLSFQMPNKKSLGSNSIPFWL